MSAPRRIALVTGAGRRRGIAAAVARALARDGWDVATTFWRSFDRARYPDTEANEPEQIAEELRAAGARAFAHEDDMSDPAAPARIFDRVEAELGQVDALLNLHAHDSGRGGILDTTAEEFDRHVAVNARGMLLMTAELGRRFGGEFGAGRVISFTSGASYVGYAASKAAIDRLTLIAAAELAPAGITVNAVDPGPTDTGWMTPQLREHLAGTNPFGRVGRPEEVAEFVAFLCSRKGDWITGQILHYDAGWSAVGWHGRNR